MNKLNTIENKQWFFALYWGQNILSYRDANGKDWDSQPNTDPKVADINDYLELKPLSSISDEDLDKIVSPNYSCVEEFLDNMKESMLYRDEADVLRGNGYALDWTTPEGETITVQMQIEFGWIKLKS